MFIGLSVDEQDSVRLLTIDDLIVIVEFLSAAEIKSLILSPLKVLCNDKSWRVRYMVADKFVQVLLLFISLDCKVCGEGNYSR